MDKEIAKLKRRLREECNRRDILLHQLSEVVTKIDRIKDQIDLLEYGKDDVNDP